MENDPASMRPAYSLGQLVAYALRLGAIGFGGPVALVGYMYRDLVEARGWIAEEDYREDLTLAQIAPGPLAAQLAIYLGHIHYRIVGATLVGIAFVLPSFLMVLTLVIVLARRSLVDAPTTLTALAAAVLLWKFKKLPEPLSSPRPRCLG